MNRIGASKVSFLFQILKLMYCLLSVWWIRGDVVLFCCFFGPEKPSWDRPTSYEVTKPVLIIRDGRVEKWLHG